MLIVNMCCILILLNRKHVLSYDSHQIIHDNGDIHETYVNKSNTHK